MHITGARQECRAYRVDRDIGGPRVHLPLFPSLFIIHNSSFIISKILFVVTWYADLGIGVPRGDRGVAGKYWFVLPLRSDTDAFRRSPTGVSGLPGRSVDRWSRGGDPSFPHYQLSTINSLPFS